MTQCFGVGRALEPTHTIRIVVDQAIRFETSERAIPPPSDSIPINAHKGKELAVLGSSFGAITCAISTS